MRKLTWAHAAIFAATVSAMSATGMATSVLVGCGASEDSKAAGAADGATVSNDTGGSTDTGQVSTGTGTVKGRLTSSDGNQHVSPSMKGKADVASRTIGGAEVGAVAVSTVGANARQVGKADIAADGSFTITQLPSVEGPFLVQALAKADG